ncbi:MAG: phosphoribosylamine--glycine ligase [Chloroflexota bacterium]|nr:phosphoribosylamine--glycine ligase [Chloroflexota bacterium]MDE2940913.1 phosphoribosylamine--glycine ligase [Chloroflexota bacterium]MDE3268386.1 phosphoribosylamine--glycine ligase [Chloroflexota bacterium]
MKVLVVGGGAREHAIAWKLSTSPLVDALFVAPGNAGTAAVAENLPVRDTDLDGLVRSAKELNVDVTFVGPEVPLAMGIVDRFTEEDLRIFGPTAAAARIESSKVFAKELMIRHGIPTGRAEVFDSYQDADRFVRKLSPPLVVKADGLAAGKGVTVARTQDEALTALRECMVEGVFGEAGERVLVEEWLTGLEVSVFAFVAGEVLSPLAAACDYKRAHDGDRGPNTGGMGVYSPPEYWNDALEREIRESIMLPVVRAMAEEGCPFSGVLYGGLMLTEDGPKVIEFNCRMGDPEAQVLMARLRTDLAEIVLATLDGMLSETPIEWSDDACVGVVLASGGYPGSYVTGFPIAGLSEAAEFGEVFHAGTKASDRSGAETVTAGGRVLTVVSSGGSLADARQRAYGGAAKVSFDGAFYRTDIAAIHKSEEGA